MKWFRSLPPGKAAILALILANLIWGAASPIFKWSLENIPLFTLAYFRFFVAAIILFPFTLKRGFHIDKKDLLPLVAMSLLGVTINITFFFLGLKLAPSINAPIIASAGPIFLVIASILFLREKPKSRTFIGTAISLLGVFTIIARPLIEEGFNYTAVEGNLFFVLATIAAVGHTVICKGLSKKYSALTLTFWLFVIGAISFFPFFLNETFQNGGLVALDIRGITGLIFGILLSSVVGYLAFQWAIEKLPASETGVFTYIDPVAATIIAVPLLGETITPLFILGSLFVFIGIMVSEGRISYHLFHKLKSA